MAESIDEMFFLRDLPGTTMLYVSPAYTKIWGRSCESLYAAPHSWLDSIHPDDRGTATEQIGMAAQTGRFAAEFRIVRPDGSIRWVSSKGFPVRDPSGALVRIAGIVQDVTARKEAFERLHETEARYRALIETSFDAIAVSRDGLVMEVNAGFERIFGFSPADVIGQPLAGFVPNDANVLIGSRLNANGPLDVEARRKDGGRILLDVTGTTHTVRGREEVISAFRDITLRRKLEGQFRQSQKLDAVGRLAAGIAHDFNNQLAVILACASFLGDRFAEGDSAREDVDEIQRAANGAASLTRQLLVFSRQQVIPPQVVALNEAVDVANRMLRHLIGEDINWVTVHGREAATTLIDPGHLEQLVVNLVLNARDAMPTGGVLTVETGVVELDGDVTHGEAPAVLGKFAMLSVSDTGTGMDEETRAKIFEPFFSTKGSGGGTGLGLATVYGIVRQAEGSITVHSEPGRGTCFKVYLPFFPGDATHADEPVEIVESLHGTESILIAEDSESVRRALRQMLERFGYRVLEAESGAQAMQFAEGTERIDLLLTDVIMPVMSGRILADRIGGLRPGLKVLFMSGYTDDAVLRHGILTSTVHYIEKPFTPATLARKVRMCWTSSSRDSVVRRVDPSELMPLKEAPSRWATAALSYWEDGRSPGVRGAV